MNYVQLCIYHSSLSWDGVVVQCETYQCGAVSPFNVGRSGSTPYHKSQVKYHIAQSVSLKQRITTKFAHLI